jgi:hypothetical protein
MRPKLFGRWRCREDKDGEGNKDGEERETEMAREMRGDGDI